MKRNKRGVDMWVYRAICGVLLVAVCCTASWATDFRQLSNQELAGLRGAIRNAPAAEQKAFQLEWEKRLAGMTEEEKKSYAEPPQGSVPEEQQPTRPHVLGRGYDDQNTGIIIYGGPGLPGALNEGAGGKK